MATIALLGAAHIHTPGFVKKLVARDDSSVKYVVDHDADRAAKNAEQLPGSTVTDMDAALGDAAVDAVVICSETNRHEDLVTATCAAGKHLFVEKPLGMGASDSFAMAKAIEQAGVIFQTGYFRRGEPAHQFIKQQIEAGAFGQITRVRHNNCHGGSLGRWFDTDWRWMADPAVAGCGAFGDLGTHSLDILLWWMGRVTQATATTQVVLGNYEDCDENGDGMLRFDGGAIGSLAAGWVNVGNPINFEVHGTEGHAIHVHNQLFFQSKLVEGADGKSPWPDEQMPAAKPHAFDLFLDAVNGDSDVELVDVHDAAHCGAVMEAMYQGAQTNAWIDVPRA
jgi:predicted dehydrogenase